MTNAIIKTRGLEIKPADEADLYHLHGFNGALITSYRPKPLNEIIQLVIDILSDRDRERAFFLNEGARAMRITPKEMQLRARAAVKKKVSL